MILNQAFYLSLMTAIYSRFADNYIDQVVNNILIPEHEVHPGKFPMDRYRRFIYEKRDKADFDDWLLQNNVPLLMNILEKGRILPEGRRSRMPEYDHIFPKSKLPAHSYSEEQINHYANMRLISAKDNNRKRNQDPKNYFEDQPEVMEYYLKPPGLLDYSQYPEFLQERRILIWEKVRIFLGLSESAEPISTTILALETKAIAPIDSEEDILDEATLIRRMISRAPISYGQRILYKTLYLASDDGMNNRELAETLSLTPYQFAGLLGALGKRVNGTEGSNQFGRIGLNLLFDISRSGDIWNYRLRPVFRTILEEDQIVDLEKA
jgi:hypothetical protein